MYNVTWSWKIFWCLSCSNQNDKLSITFISFLGSFSKRCTTAYNKSNGSCQLFEKSCGKSWTTFCGKSHLLLIPSPILHICHRCTCWQWFSSRFNSFSSLGTKWKPILLYSRERCAAWTKLEKSWKYDNKNEEGFLDGFFPQRYCTSQKSKPINTGPSPPPDRGHLRSLGVRYNDGRTMGVSKDGFQCTKMHPLRHWQPL